MNAQEREDMACKYRKRLGGGNREYLAILGAVTDTCAKQNGRISRLEHEGEKLAVQLRASADQLRENVKLFNEAEMALRLLEVERDKLTEDNVKLREGVASFSGTAGELDTERMDLQAELEKLREKVCDECDGSGTCYLTNDETEERVMHPCVCVSETDSYQKLVSELSELRNNHLPKVEAALSRANETGAECDRRIKQLECEAETLRWQARINRRK